MPLPAVEVSKKLVTPPGWVPVGSLLVAPLFVNKVMFPAVALFLKEIVPAFPDASTSVTKF